MANVRFFINNNVCDIKTPDAGITINNEFIKPSDFSSNDVTYSYTITFPFSKKNHRIFGYGAVENVKNKFNRIYDAYVTVDSVKVFDGNFKLTEIGDNGYKGNLYIANRKTTSQIFSDSTLQDNGTWLVDAKNKWNETINYYNGLRDNGKETPCIFPFVMYGYLPKIASKYETVYDEVKGVYTPVNVLDNTVRMSYSDFPPSINIMQCVRKIFNNNGYNLIGDALTDERLTNIYMSYKNPSDYEQPWNVYDMSELNILGTWNTYTESSDTTTYQYVYRNEQDNDVFYSADILGGSNTTIVSVDDKGDMLTEYSTPSYYSSKYWTRKRREIVVPRSGMYVMKLFGSYKMKDPNVNNFKTVKFSDEDGNSDTVCYTQKNVTDAKPNDFYHQRFEIQVLRDFADDLDLDSIKVVGQQFKPNISTSSTTVLGRSMFPQQGKLQLIDHSNCKNFVCGVGFGKQRNDGNSPLVADNDFPHNPMVISQDRTWDKSFEDTKYFNNFYNFDKYYVYGITDISTLSEGYELGNGGHKAQTLQGADDNYTNASNDYLYSGDGGVSCAVYLEKGERLSIYCVCDAGDWEGQSKKAFVDCNVSFSLNLKYISSDKFLDLNNAKGIGNTVGWNYDENKNPNKIDLIKFLDKETKTNDFINNVVTTFNLRLTQVDNRTFKMSRSTDRINDLRPYVDIDNKSNFILRTNEPLDIPSTLTLKFTNSDSEYGLNHYGTSGSNVIDYGTVGGSDVSVESKFSYNWYYPLEYTTYGTTAGTWHKITVPIISDYGIFSGISSAESSTTYPFTTYTSDSYADNQKNYYSNLSYRLWYYSGMLNNGSISINGKTLNLVDVGEYYVDGKPNKINYYNGKHTLYDNFFRTIDTNESNYTIVETYLKPYEYANIVEGYLVKFNNDIYYVSEVQEYNVSSGYSKLKLIRKVNKV